MSETFITIIAIMSAVVLMFAVPFIATANQNEKITQSAIQTILDNFTNTVAREGKISKSTYNDLIEELHATGNTYDVSLEVQLIDDNPGAKGDNKDVIGENIYYSEYTSTIVEKLNEGDYLLHQGDYVIANVKNTNVTTMTAIKNFFYGLVGKETIALDASSTILISKTGYTK